jgi:hypothetical protein
MSSLAPICAPLTDPALISLAVGLSRIGWEVARPGLVDLVGISLDIALVFGPVDPDASREIDHRLIDRNGKRYGWRHE